MAGVTPVRDRVQLTPSCRLLSRRRNSWAEEREAAATSPAGAAGEKVGVTTGPEAGMTVLAAAGIVSRNAARSDSRSEKNASRSDSRSGRSASKSASRSGGGAGGGGSRKGG